MAMKNDDFAFVLFLSLCSVVVGVVVGFGIAAVLGASFLRSLGVAILGGVIAPVLTYSTIMWIKPWDK